MSKQISGILLVLLIGLGCAPDPTVIARQEPFFDLAAYIDSEAARLKKLENFSKATTVNGVSESQQIDTINAFEELTIFRNSDINRIAWIDQYTIDSTFSRKGRLEQLRYTTSNEDLRTRELTIYYIDEVVSEIRILNKASSAITSSQQTLLYNPTKGYSIESRQKLVTAAPREVKVEVRFQ